MTGWSMKKDWEIIKLAREKLSIDQIATKMGIVPPSVIRAAKRLGISAGPKRDGRLKAKRK